MSTLFTNDNSGVISCIEHGGHYLRVAVTERPNAKQWVTPLGTWRRWTDADEAEWDECFGKPAHCETCGPAKE